MPQSTYSTHIRRVQFHYPIEEGTPSNKKTFLAFLPLFSTFLPSFKRRPFMKLLRSFKRMIKNSDQATQLVEKIHDKLSSLADLNGRRSNECLELAHQMIALQKVQMELLNRLVQQGHGKPMDLTQLQKPPLKTSEPSSSFKDAISRIPLMLADKTYNTSHPEYDANLVRNYPGRIFNAAHSSKNGVYQALMPMITKNREILEIADHAWQEVLTQILEEVKTIPHSSQVFERKAYIEKYVAGLSARYGAHYQAGWVNLEDALFLYWLVRCLKPKTIVQTGVCNGLSTAFMMLALVKNGPEGRLHVIDLPPIFNPEDPAWTVSGQVYGVLIPEGKTSAWVVPDAYQDRLHVQCGDAKQLLPPLVDQLASIDMFYHDSDHTYEHMMFEFHEAKRKLTPGGLIVGDDISWNASVWDFADKHGVPSFNYKGAVGVAFF